MQQRLANLELVLHRLAKTSRVALANLKAILQETVPVN